MGCGSSVTVDNDRTVANNLDKPIHEAARSSKDENKSSNGLSANDLYKEKNFEKKEISTQVSFESLSAEQPLPKEKTNDVEKKDICTQTSLVSLAKEMPMEKEKEKYIEKKEIATQASLEKERVSECLENEKSKQREKEDLGNEDKANKNLPDKNEDVKGKNKDLTKANDVKIDFEDIDAHALKAPDDVCGSTRDLADYLMKGTTDQLYIARSFYRWITDNISYDTESFFGDKKKPVDAESVLRLRTAVCAGYAYLFEELCKHAGIKVKVIGGYTKGYRYNPENPFSYRYKTDHAWNAIDINNKWHFVECTWGAGHLDKQGKFQKEFDDYYFLTDPKHFISDHFPYIDRDIEGSKQWQLLDPPFTLEEFSKAVNFTRFARTWGLKFSHNDAVIQVDKAFELEIQDTSRALIDSSIYLMYSNGLRCDEYMFFRLTQPNLYKATIRLPKRGTYKLEVYGKVDSLQDGLNNLVTYILKCPSVDSTVQPYPKHSGLWGFDSKAFDIGFKHSIAPKIIHKALHGKLSLELPADIVPPSMSHFTGTSSNEDLKRFTLLETKSNALQVRIRLPRKEFYKLEVLCKTDNSKRYYPVMSFLIDGTLGTLDKAVPFPKTYPHTQEFLCELLEPTTGILSANTPIAIRFKSPKLVKGFVHGTNYTDLKITEDVWEAKVTTNEPGGVLSVNGNDTGEESFWSLYEFQII